MTAAWFIILSSVCGADQEPALITDRPLRRLAFGSCVQQGKPQPVWDEIIASRPDLMVLLGDNIYGDSEDVKVLKEKYAMLGSDPGFERLRKCCPIIATWDDHDYGSNDAGAEFPSKAASQRVFLEFFGEPPHSARWSRPGVYGAWFYGPAEQRVQIILLDTRYFRSKLRPRVKRGSFGEGRPGIFAPNDKPDATILGDAQWQWLEDRLREPARLRIIGSSIQVIANDHAWEKWGNFPKERERLFQLIRKTRAEGVIFLSGDRHLAELSRLEGAVGYPLLDLTSSSLNLPSRWINEINVHRVGTPYFEENFGLIEIDWQLSDPTLSLRIHGLRGVPRIVHRLRLSELRPAGTPGTNAPAASSAVKP